MTAPLRPRDDRGGQQLREAAEIAGRAGALIARAAGRSCRSTEIVRSAGARHGAERAASVGP
jgi:hypothetical protein